MKVEYETYTMANGMRVLLIPSNSTYSITVSAKVRSGATFENVVNNGLSHFIEHLSLTATEKWPTKKELNTITEFSGANSNASTSYDSMNYYINIPYKKLAFGIEYIQQILYFATFEDKIIEQERTVILNEISQYKDSVNYQGYRYAIEKFLDKNSSYTKEILGSESNIKNATKKNLLKHYKAIHDPSRILITVVGKFKKEKAIEFINKYFEQIESKNNEEIKYPKSEILNNTISTKKDKKTNLVQTYLLFQSEGYKTLSNKESIGLNLLLKILSGPMGSRLMSRLRDEEGLLYGIYAENISYNKLGANYVYFDIPADLHEKALKIVIEEIVKFYEKGITQEELIHYKEYATNRNLVHYDNIHSYSNLISGQIFIDEPIQTIEEINNTIKNFDIKYINKLIKKHLNIHEMSCIAYGDVKPDTEDAIKKIINDQIKN